MRIKDKAIKSLIIASALILLSNTMLYATPFAWISAVVCSAVAAYLTYACGISAGVSAAAAVCVFNVCTSVCLSLMPYYTALFLSLIAVAPGLVCGICISKKAGIRDGIFAVTAVLLVFPLAVLAYVKFALEIDIFSAARDAVISFLNSQLVIIKSIYPDLLKLIEGNEPEFFAAAAIYLPGLLPCLIIALCFITAAVIYWLAKHMANRTMILNSHFIQSLDCFYIPKHTAVVLLLSMVCMTLPSSTLGYMFFLIVTVVILIMYMFDGISLIDYFLKQKNFNGIVRAVLLLSIIVVTFIVSAVIPFLNPLFVFAVMGIADSASDFRRLNVNKGEHYEN